MNPITETFLISATNNDVLEAPSRLAAIPYNGTLTLEMAATVCTSTNNMAVTIQLPSGEVPMDGQVVPANGYDTTNEVLHNDSETVFTFPASQGGHFTIDVVEQGTATLILRATLTPG